MRLAAFALLLLLAPPARGDDPPKPPVPLVPVASITAPAVVAPGCPIVLYGDQATSSGPLSWKLITPKVAFQVYDQGDRKGVLLLVPVPAPGVYKFAQVATGPGGSFDFDFAEVTVGPVPTPVPAPPDPVPVPPAPSPAPVVKLGSPFYVELVIDPAAMTPRMAALADSTTIGPAVRSLGGRFQPIATTSPEFARRNLAKFVGPGLVAPPALLVRDAAGEKVIAEPAPQDEPAVVARIKSLIGGAQ